MDQLALPLGKPRTPSDLQAVSVGRRTLMVQFVRHLRARRYVLRMLPDGAVRVTIPRSGSRAQALSFLRRELRWLDLQRYAAERAAGTVLLRGEPLTLTPHQTRSGTAVTIAGESVAVRHGESTRQAAIRHLRALAVRDLPGRLHQMAARFDFVVKRVTIRSQQTRWGSCSADGAIALNWRLVQMPDAVRDYILVHELMHLRQRNHSRRFWSLVEKACPDYRAAREWLKEHEKELR